MSFLPSQSQRLRGSEQWAIFLLLLLDSFVPRKLQQIAYFGSSFISFCGNIDTYGNVVSLTVGNFDPLITKSSGGTDGNDFARIPSPLVRPHKLCLPTLKLIQVEELDNILHIDGKVRRRHASTC